MNILAIGAHFDDIELGCAGALRKHVLNGDKVYEYVATNSGYTNPMNVVIRDGRTAENEGRKAAEIIGAELITGDFKTLQLEFDDLINSQLIRIIEEKKIDTIYTHGLSDVHHDHIALAKSSLHAGRHVPRLLQYRSNWYRGNDDSCVNFYVDISAVWDVKEAAIRAHETEFSRAGKDWLTFFKNEAKNNGLICGVEYAEGYRVVKWLQ